ncbi:MAG TPA: alpha-glucan family phosphorylase, partial [Steroidobacteraceae bacterium]|nr:alpha-glucan family phosphorylase [Steroidobacteraceae bacterium]
MVRTAERSIHLPEALRAIEPLAFNLRWVWNHGADFVWSTLNAEVWKQTRNPVLVLRNTPRSRLEKLAYDGEFLWRLEHLARHEQEYLARPSWFQQTHTTRAPPLTAYFSMEYGISDALPLYSGGLGVLAGDHLKTASDLGVPLVAVGIFYREGYFRQMLDADGEQHEIYAINSPGSLPVNLVTDDEGMPLRISIEFPGRDLRLRIWRADVGRVPLYLLDSDDPLNTPFDRGITAKLYAGEPETRLAQEIVLGVGGWRALEALGYDVDVCHLNEGHAAFATLERARRYAERNACSFMTALWATRAGNVFTTHTPVAAAFDLFPVAMMQRYGSEYARLCGLEPARMMVMGRA